jgi:hypothetical protein
MPPRRRNPSWSKPTAYRDDILDVLDEVFPEGAVLESRGSDNADNLRRAKAHVRKVVIERFSEQGRKVDEMDLGRVLSRELDHYAGQDARGPLVEVFRRKTAKSRDDWSSMVGAKNNPRRRRNPAKKPRPLSRAEKAVRRVEEALKAGVVLHWSAARGDGTAGPYHTAVGSPKFAVIAYGRHPYDYVGSLNEVAYHLVDHIGVANVIESLKATARLHGTAYTNLDTPISWGSPARHRRNPAKITAKALATALIRAMDAALDSGDLSRMNAVHEIVEQEHYLGVDGLYLHIRHDPVDFILVAAPGFSKALKRATGKSRDEWAKIIG